MEREGHKVRRNVGSFDTAQEAAVQRALALLGSVEVLSPSSRGPRSTGMLPVLTVASLSASYSHVYCLGLTGAKSEVSSAALGELSINLFGNVMPLSAPARAAVASDEAACSDRQCCGCGRPRTAAQRCLCELHRAHEGLGHGGLQHVVPC